MNKLFVACVLALGISTVAYAEIELDVQETYYINISYKNSNEFNRATVLVLDEILEAPLYAGETKNVTYDSETGYTANFDRIKLNSRLADGKYKVRVTAGRASEEAEFEFSNMPAKIQAMQRVKDAQNADELKRCFDEDYLFLDIDNEKYQALSDKKAVFSKLLFEDVEFDDAAVSSENLEAQQQVLYQSMKKQYEILDLVCAKNNLSEVIDNLKIILVDKTYYDKLVDKTKLTEIYSSYEVDRISDISLEALKEKFDGAVLCATVLTCDFKTAEDALAYYENKGLIRRADRTYYNMLSEIKRTEVFGRLKSSGVSDYNALPSAFEAAAQNIYEGIRVQSSAPSGTSGGRGGGASIGTIVSKPNNENDDIETQKKSFSDISGVSWAEDAIYALFEEGHISGDENGLFNPYNNITREEFVKIAVLVFGKYNGAAETDFADTEKNKWYYRYVASGVEAGIINGVSENLFGVGKSITREDAATILGRIYDTGEENYSIDFKDGDLISGYARNQVSKLAGAGVIVGNEAGEFCPKNNLTRAEAAVLIYRLRNLVDLKGE